MLKAAIAHKGTVMLDVISPCVTFNDHEGSTKSYKYMKDHEEPLTDASFVPDFDAIDVEYDPGSTASRSRCTTGHPCACASWKKTTTRPNKIRRHEKPHGSPRERRGAHGCAIWIRKTRHFRSAEYN